MFERLEKRAEAVASREAEAVRNRLLAAADLPSGVTAQAISGGIALTGKGLRRRLINDAKLRNFTR